MRRALALLAAAVCLALGACGGGDNEERTTPPATTPASAGGGGPGGGGAGAGGVSGNAQGVVSIKDIKFVPQTVTARVGQTITWTNNDPVAHTVTARSGASFDSGIVQPGGAYRQKMTRAGTIAYVCTIHPNQTGTIRVTR